MMIMTTTTTLKPMKVMMNMVMTMTTKGYDHYDGVNDDKDERK